jgi:hypothetical protein
MQEPSPEARAALDAAMGIEPAEAPAPEPEAAPAAEPEQPPHHEAAPSSVPPSEPEPDSSLSQLPEILRLKKQAERKARDATDKARAEVEQAKAELEKLRAQIRQPIDDPVAFYREQGMNPLEVAQMIASAELPPEKANPQARLRYEQLKQRNQAQSEIQKLRAELEEFKTQQQQALEQQQATQILQQIRTEDEALLQNSLPADSLVAGLYRVNADYALEQMLEFRRRYADTYPEDPIPQANEVAEYLEKQLKSIGYTPPAVGKPAETVQPPKPVEAQGEPSPTLSSNELAGRTAKDEIPTDEEELIQYLAAKLRAGETA